MHPVLIKTFGGLSRAYYLRHLLFGTVFLALLTVMIMSGGNTMPLKTGVFFVTSTLLYPYARFVYESVVSFVMGRNTFLVNAALMLSAKLVMMVICWFFAVFIAPIGLIWLYFHHTKMAQQ